MRRRGLRDEERALWEKVARTVAPLRPSSTSVPAIEAATEAPMGPEGAKAAANAAPAAPAAPAPARRSQRPRAIGDIDRQTRRKLARGMLPIDARLDLHGMTQEEAHRVLARFILSSADAGRRVVLVITGKGAADGTGRGVLRRNVPHWLASRELARLVVGFGPAHASHGGDGALYVRLRAR